MNKTISIAILVFFIASFVCSGPLSETAIAQTSPPAFGLLMLPAGSGAYYKSSPDENSRSQAGESQQGCSVVDIVGIVLFFTLIGAHFFMCRKGVYPESSCLCDPPRWLKKVTGKMARKLSGT